MKKYRKLRLLSYLVIAYMLMAFTWWSVLLFTKNADAFLAKRDLLRIGMVAEDLYHSELQFLESAPYQDLARKYKRQEWMIMGEAAVFVITLILGVWMINRGYNREMQAATQRRNFLLSITHELKSPISSIRLVLDTFQKRVLKPEQSKRILKSGLLETERLNQLVNNLLLSARLESSFHPVMESLDLDELCRDIIFQVQEKYPKANVDIESDFKGRIIQADRMGLTSVLLNLLENAIKYSEPPAQVQLCLTDLKDLIQIEIKDQGMGIPDSEKRRIFEQFYRVGNEDTRNTKGTGLGLYIVDQIIQAHHGKVLVFDNKPKGSVFQISIPLERKGLLDVKPRF